MPLKIKCIPEGKTETNCYIVWDEVSKDAVVIDPGFEDSNIFKYLVFERLTCKYVLLTHGHHDHVFGVPYMKRMYPRTMSYMHDGDLEIWAQNAKGDFYVPENYPEKPDRSLQDGQKFKVGEHTFTAVHCPGHTPGSCIFMEKTQRLVFSGDVILDGKRGPTDQPGGDAAAMDATIELLKKELEAGYTIYPGHGDPVNSGSVLRNL